jgi:hypothetical protein
MKKIAEQAAAAAAAAAPTHRLCGSRVQDASDPGSVGKELEEGSRQLLNARLESLWRKAEGRKQRRGTRMRRCCAQRSDSAASHTPWTVEAQFGESQSRGRW